MACMPLHNAWRYAQKYTWPATLRNCITCHSPTALVMIFCSALISSSVIWRRRSISANSNLLASRWSLSRFILPNSRTCQVMKSLWQSLQDNRMQKNRSIPLMVELAELPPASKAWLETILSISRTPPAHPRLHPKSHRLPPRRCFPLHPPPQLHSISIAYSRWYSTTTNAADKCAWKS